MNKLLMVGGIGLAIGCAANRPDAAPTRAKEAQSHARFDPRTLKGPRHGVPNEVIVLGSPHLDGLPESFDPATLGPMLDRLAAWGPRAVAVELLSGAQCAFMREYPARYRDTVKTFCWDPSPAQAATGLNVQAATEEAERRLSHWPSRPAPGERRHLAAVFLAAGESPSALLHWLRLAPEERRPGDGLDAALVARLETLRGRRNEALTIGSALAARLGLDRVYGMDDHTADRPVAEDDEKLYDEAISRAWNNPATARRKAVGKALEEHLGTGEDVRAMYRAYNAPEEPQLAFESDFGAALEEPSSQRFGRVYVGYWETRNLRMAANIRDILSAHPGERLLVIVGASHKGYLDAYLDEMHDVRIVDTDVVLR